MKKTSPDIVAIYHKNPKVKVSDVLTGFCCAPKFCDGRTDRQTDRHTHTLSVSNSTEVENIMTSCWKFDGKLSLLSSDENL